MNCFLRFCVLLLWSLSSLFETSAVFSEAKVFNSDLAKWNVAKVTNMGYSTCQFPLFNSPLHHLLFFFFLSLLAKRWCLSPFILFILILIYKSFFLFCTVFTSAAAFTDNTFFCVGLWMSSSLKPSNMGNSGVTDFSCGGRLRNINIQLAVNDWIDTSKRSSVESTYGLIQDWNTSQVTSMYQLFNQKKTFNANISKWNVAKVTNMNSSTFQFPLFNSSLLAQMFIYFLISKKIASYV